MFPGSLVGEIFAEQIEATIRHHALESGCFVVNATSWLSPEQQKQICDYIEIILEIENRDKLEKLIESSL